MNDSMTQESSGTTASFYLGFLLLIVAAFVSVRDTLSCDAPLDDAFISMRYARNFAEGHGLVFNPGEYVEGYTNMAWTLLLAVATRLGFDTVDVARVLDGVFALAVLTLVYRFATRAAGGRSIWAAGLAPLALVAGPSLAAWTIAGLGETMYVTAVVAAFYVGVFAPVPAMCAAAIVVTLIRPEGMLVAACVWLGRWVARPGEFRTLVAWGLAYTAFVAGLTGLRLAYYGLPLPNTFFAKVGGVPVELGLAYVRAFLMSGALLLIPPALVALWSDRRLWGIAIYIAVTTVFVIRIGGDVFEYNRFFLATFALLAAVSIRVLSSPQLRHRAGYMALAALVAAAPLVAYTSLSARLTAEDPPLYARRGVALGKLCHAQTVMRDENRTRAARLEAALGDRVDQSIVAATVIGALGWYGRFPILDVFGLTDREIARHESVVPAGALVLPGHHRSHPDYVMSRAPEFIVMGKNPTGPKTPAVLDIGAHPDFVTLYEWDPSVSAHRRRQFP